MLEFTKSLMSFPWVMSTFGAQQLVNALSQNGGKKVDESLYTVTKSIEDQFNDLVWAAFQVGDEMQREFVELVFRVVTFEAFTPACLSKVASGIAHQSTEAIRTLTPGPAGLAWQELKNNYEVYNLVKHVHELLKIPAEGEFPIEELIKRAYALGQYTTLWAVEGLGHDYADWFLTAGLPQRQILTSERARALPPESMTMMHAGIGLSFARRLMDTITPYSPPANVRGMLEEFISLVKTNSQEGYEGAAYESLGLVTRTWFPLMVRLIDEHLQALQPEAAEYFWHGVGRALYFLPIHFVPGLSSPWRAAEQESPHETARRNSIAGLAWATTVVNSRQPEILFELVQHRGEQLARDDAFSNGVMSTLIMAHDIVPDNVYITGFRRYRPDVPERWDTLVAIPVAKALDQYYPVLKQRRRLGEVFRYQPLEELVNRLR